MASAALSPKFPSRRSATCPVPQIRVLPVVSRADAAAGAPSRVMYISSCGPLIHRPSNPFTSTSAVATKWANFWKKIWSRWPANSSIRTSPRRVR